MGNMNKLLTGAALVVVGAVSTPVFAGGKVNVMLQEWRVVADTKKVSAGDVTFTVQNRGKEVHELVLLKTDSSYDKLTMSKEGGIDEEAAGTVIAEIEDLEPKMIKSMSAKLEPGNYVLLCNVVENEPDGTKEEHYKMGMRIPLIVQ